MVFNNARQDRRGWLSSILVVVIAFLVYADSLGNGHVLWDGEKIVVNNPTVQGSPPALFERIDTALAIEPTPYYHSLALLSFHIEDRLHGLDPFWMHLLNILLHAANAFPVYLLARAIIANDRAALLAGLLFAVRPPQFRVCTQSGSFPLVFVRVAICQTL